MVYYRSLFPIWNPQRTSDTVKDLVGTTKGNIADMMGMNEIAADGRLEKLKNKTEYS